MSDSVPSTPAPQPAPREPDRRDVNFAANLPPRVVVELAPARWQRWSAWFGWAGFLVCVVLLIGQSITLQQYFTTQEGIQERYHSGSRTARDKIAVITVSGVIMEGDGFVKRQIDAIREDDHVRGVVVRVESPGGTVTGSDYIFHHLQRLRETKKIPIVVSMGSVAASGGYYVAMAVGDQEKSIYAEPTTSTGSIGVVIPHYDVSGLLSEWNVRDDSIASHPRKLMLSMTRPMSEEERALAQEYVDETFQRFVSVVKQGRPALRDQEGLKHGERDLATGELFSAERAKQYGLVDEIGFIEDALARVAELSKVELDDVRVVHYKRLGGLLDSFLGLAEARAQTRSPLDWPALLEGTVPRAYYLCTTLPTVIAPREQ